MDTARGLLRPFSMDYLRIPRSIELSTTSLPTERLCRRCEVVQLVRELLTGGSGDEERLQGFHGSKEAKLYDGFGNGYRRSMERECPAVGV